MDLFKKLKDWLGTPQQSAPKQPVAKPQVIASMPKMLNQKGQQDWMRKNAPQQPAKPQFPGVNAPKAPSFTPVTPPKPVTPPAPAPATQQPPQQPKPRMLGDQVKAGPTVGLPDVNAQRQKVIDQQNQARQNKQMEAQRALEVKVPVAGNAVQVQKKGDQPSVALGGRSITNFIADYNKADAETQRTIRKNLEKQREHFSTASSQSGRALLTQTDEAIKSLDTLGDRKATTFKGAAADIGEFGKKLLVETVTAGKHVVNPAVAPVLADQQLQRLKSGEIGQDEYNRNIKRIADNSSAYWRYGTDERGNAVLRQPHENDDGSERSLLEATAKFGAGFADAGVAAGTVVAPIVQPARIAGLGVKEATRELVKEGAAYQAVDMTNEAVQGRNPLDPTFLAMSAAANFGLPAASQGVRALRGGSAVEDAAVTPRQENVTSRTPQQPQERAAAIERGVITPETKSLPLGERVATALNHKTAVEAPGTAIANTPAAQSLTAAPELDQLTPQAAPVTMQPELNGSQIVDQPVINPNQPVINPNQPVPSAIDPQLTNLAQAVDNPYLAPAVQQVNPVAPVQLPEVPSYRMAGDAFTDQPIANAIQEHELIAQSQRMFGDDRVSMPTELRGENGERLLGRYQNGEIEVRAAQPNAEATFFHEAVHKAIAQYTTVAERSVLFEEARVRYGDDALVNEARSNGYSRGLDEAIEERIANDFIAYAAKRSASANISQRMQAIFEDIVARIQAAFGRGDVTRDFMKDLFDGRFASEKPLTSRQAPELHPAAIELDSQYQSLQQRFDTTTDPAARSYINQAMAANRTERARIDQDPKYRTESGDYRMDHRPQQGDSVIDIANGAGGHLDYAASRTGSVWSESLEALSKLKTAAPDDLVTIYRSSPSSQLNDGDWVTLSKEYAELMAESKVDGSKVNEFKVPAKDVRFAGDNITEFGYFRSDSPKYSIDPEAREKVSSVTESEYDDMVDTAYRKNEQSKLEADSARATAEAKAVEADPKVAQQRARVENERKVSEAIQRGFEAGPRHTVDKIIDAAAELGFVPRKKVRAMAEKYADDHGYDITTGRAFKKVDEEVTGLADEDGKIKPIDQIQPSDEILKQIKRPGVKHAVPYGTHDASDMVRQMVYKHDDGTPGAYFEYKTPDGKWQKSGLEAVDIKSPQSGIRLGKLKSNAAVNAEAKRAYEEGTTAQYIWRENDAGVNSEFVREFDAAMGDASKLDKIDSNKIVGFDPDKHYIEAGKVVDAETGQILGNYIEITPEGVNMFAGRQRISLNYNELDLASIREMKTSGLTWTTEGIIDRITGNLKHTNSVDYFKKGGHKTKEALMHVMVEEPRAAQRNILDEDNALGNAVDQWESAFKKSVKRSKLADARRDAVYVIEPIAKKTPGEKTPSFEERLKNFEENYGPKAAEQLKAYDQFMRGVYDNLLVRMNNERLAIGQPAIKRRKNYITHIAEMADGGILRQSIQGINNMIGGDVMIDSRGTLPSSITGTTGTRKPKSKYNPFSQSRLADNKPLNPFDPLRVYSNLALQNIHMTKAITMNRSIETSIRGLSEAKQEMSSPRGIQYVSEMLDDIVDKSRNGKATAEDYTTLSRKLFGLSRVFQNIEGLDGFQRVLRKAAKEGESIDPDARLSPDEATTFGNAATLINEQLGKLLDDVEMLNNLKAEADGLQQFVGIIQEHTNKLAGKTNWMIRGLKDLEKGKGTDLGLLLVKGAQQHAALTSIVGNANSTLAQLMATPLVMGTTRPRYQFEGLRHMNDKALMKKSDALWIRYKESILAQKSTFQKTMDVGGLPLLTVERSVMKWTFASKYAEGLGRGLNERQAIKYAERFIGDTTSWRDVASAPRAYDRPIPASLLQFTREVTQQYRGFWNRFTPAEKAKTLIAVAVVSNAMALLTGNKMGADPITAVTETGFDLAGANDTDREDEENTPWAKAVRAGQNMLSEVVSAVPMASAAANTIWSKDDRQKIFGEDSNLGRYEGNMALFSALGNLVRGTNNLASGNTDQAWKDFTKTLPIGSQLQKTASGLQALLRGYTTTSTGKVKATIDQGNPANWILGTLFGPNALFENREANKTGNTLSEKQSTFFLELEKKGKSDQANAYFEAVKAKLNDKEAKKSDAKADETGKDLAYDEDSLLKFAEGTWKVENGKVVDEDGKTVSKFYKERAELNKDDKSDKTYKDFITGYGLVKEAEESKTGNGTLDKLANLDNQQKAADRASTAVDLLTDSKEDYKNIPDWVKDRFYKESGFHKKDVEYAASTTYSVDAKIDGYFRPLAESGDRTALLDELYRGRVKGINGKYFATSTVIERLYDEGFLSKDERNTLKKIDLNREGKQMTDITGGGNGSGKGSGKKGGAGYTAADISKFVNGGGSENYSAIAGILKATRSSADNSGSQKISSPSVQIRGLRAIVNSRKQSTKKRRLA